MKRLKITPAIEAHLRRALGPDVDAQSYPVFEATALNTLPIRKQHPLYKGARAEVSLLHEMAASLASESVPLQVEHNSDSLAVGRVFHSEVRNTGFDSELRVLFWIDPTEAASLSKVETGTVDQVSVNFVPKQALNSVSGFDYRGPDATLDNFLTGDDGKGNILGQNGVYARLSGLENFFEVSLVSQGGAQNARIHRRDQSHFGSSYEQLAASGLDPNVFVVAASTGEHSSMDLTELVTKLTAKEVEVARLSDQNAALTQTNTDLQAQVATLTADKAELTTKVADSEAKDIKIADLDVATTALRDVAQTMLTATGKTDALPDAVAELASIIETGKTDLAAMLTAGGKAKGADASTVTNEVSLTSRGAFRMNRK